MNLYHRLLGSPFVYNKIRPFVVGGMDLTQIYESFNVGPLDRVLDLGCGTGEALKYLKSFDQYLGIDIDPIAVQSAQKKRGQRPGIKFKVGELSASDVDGFRPTRVIMGGVLHHINDPLAHHLFGLLLRSPDLVSVLTYDAVYLPKDVLNNVLASLDRGRHSKTPEGYVELAQSAGFNVVDQLVRTYSPTGGLGKFFAMTLAPRR